MPKTEKQMEKLLQDKSQKERAKLKVIEFVEHFPFKEDGYSFSLDGYDINAIIQTGFLNKQGETIGEDNVLKITLTVTKDGVEIPIDNPVNLYNPPMSVIENDKAKYKPKKAIQEIILSVIKMSDGS